MTESKDPYRESHNQGQLDARMDAMNPDEAAEAGVWVVRNQDRDDADEIVAVFADEADAQALVEEKRYLDAVRVPFHPAGMTAVTS